VLLADLDALHHADGGICDEPRKCFMSARHIIWMQVVKNGNDGSRRSTHPQYMLYGRALKSNRAVGRADDHHIPRVRGYRAETFLAGMQRPFGCYPRRNIFPQTQNRLDRAIGGAQGSRAQRKILRATSETQGNTRQIDRVAFTTAQRLVQRTARSRLRKEIVPTAPHEHFGLQSQLPNGRTTNPSNAEVALQNEHWNERIDCC
jgi:hypothetical protein